MPETEDEFSFMKRRKTTLELIRLSLSVMGMELAYAAETAFVTPVLIGLGVEHSHALLLWAISPVLGFFFSPVLGTASDRCSLALGRRRPFIAVLAVGIVLGLVLVPYSRDLGALLGDGAGVNGTSAHAAESLFEAARHAELSKYSVALTVVGLVLIDFCADASQSPTRAYLIDVVTPEDQGRGISMFMILTGIGGSLGYILGAIDWTSYELGSVLADNVKIVFSTVVVIYFVSIIFTVTAFKEMPLKMVNELKRGDDSKDLNDSTDRSASDDAYFPLAKETIRAIVGMPKSIVILYVTHLLCWMAHLSFVLYFTEYVGEVIFEGDPHGETTTISGMQFQEGVRFGCCGLAFYAASVSAYSLTIEYLSEKFKVKYVYTFGLLIYAFGMILISLLPNKVTALLACITAGIQYGTLFNIPYKLLAYYHTTGRFSEKDVPNTPTKRGLGADLGILGTAVFLSQFILSLGLSVFVDIVGSISITIWVATIFAIASSFMTLKVLYLDL